MITRDEWLRAMEAANVETVLSDDSALTAKEFADMFGIDRQAANRRLKKLEAAGKATLTSKMAPDSAGKRVYWKAWKLVDETPKKKRR